LHVVTISLSMANDLSETRASPPADAPNDTRGRGP